MRTADFPDLHQDADLKQRLGFDFVVWNAELGMTRELQ